MRHTKGQCTILKPNTYDDSRICYRRANHDGLHHWEMCGAEYECYVMCPTYSCELAVGHVGSHETTIEWD